MWESYRTFPAMDTGVTVRQKSLFQNSASRLVHVLHRTLSPIPKILLTDTGSRLHFFVSVDSIYLHSMYFIRLAIKHIHISHNLMKFITYNPQ